MPSEFEQILRGYLANGVVFQSPERAGAWCYRVVEVHDDGVVVESPFDDQTTRVDFSLVEEFRQRLRQQHGTVQLDDLEYTRATQAVLLQTPNVGVSANRKEAIDLSEEADATQSFQELLGSLRVDKSGPRRKLYKPTIVWCVLKGILDGELTENRVTFDWLLPRFRKKAEELGAGFKDANAAEAFFHLANEFFWILAYRDPKQYFQRTPSPKEVRANVAHALIKDTYWRLLSNKESVGSLISTLEEEWFVEAGADVGMSLEIDLRILDLAIEQTIRPLLIGQGVLADPKGEGYHHQSILPTAQSHLTRASLDADPRGNLEAAFKAHRNLLSPYELMAALQFVRAADVDELRDRTIALLYGSEPLPTRLQTFWSWSKQVDDGAGKKTGINVTAISYLLAMSDPQQFAFCKPTVYAAAAKALLKQAPEQGEDRLNRLIDANQFYGAALRLFQTRYKLPFTDLQHVHIAFFVMHKPYEGFPDWDHLLDGRGGTTPMKQADLNVILYGPPGTGKTYDTLRRAVEICDGSAPVDRNELSLRFRKLREENRVAFVTFHQSYGYEDFVEGIRPVLEDRSSSEKDRDSSEVRYECRPGVFKGLCTLARSTATHQTADDDLDLDDVDIWKMSLGDTSLSSEAGVYDECIDNNYVLLGYGGSIDFSACQSREAIQELVAQKDPDASDFVVQAVETFKLKMKSGDLVVVSDGNHKFRAIGRVTGEYSLKPEDDSGYRQMRPVEWLLVLDESLPRETIYGKIFSQMTIYKLQKPLLKLDAIRDLLIREPGVTKNFVMIIDEINRGNIAKILGELITLLEPDKRLGQPNELQVTLPYSGTSFGVPSNVYVVGTMNTADRSIAFLDVALRRRFRFVELMPDPGLIRQMLDDDGVVEGVDIPDVLDVINQRVELLLDRDHQIGHSFFLQVESLTDLRDVFCGKVIPLLQEYFYGDWGKVGRVLGSDITAANASASSSPALIRASGLQASTLLPGGDDLPEDKVRCAIDPVFTTATSAETLRPFFKTVLGTAKVT